MVIRDRFKDQGFPPTGVIGKFPPLAKNRSPTKSQKLAHSCHPKKSPCIRLPQQILYSPSKVYSPSK